MVYNNSSIKNKEILVHTNCSYNNTIITATDQTGNTISWSSGVDLLHLPLNPRQSE